jgi:hypothetical protein
MTLACGWNSANNQQLAVGRSLGAEEQTLDLRLAGVIIYLLQLLPLLRLLRLVENHRYQRRQKNRGVGIGQRFFLP